MFRNVYRENIVGRANFAVNLFFKKMECFVSLKICFMDAEKAEIAAGARVAGLRVKLRLAGGLALPRHERQPTGCVDERRQLHGGVA